MTTIEVLPDFTNKCWSVAVNGIVMGRGKDSIDCDVWARHFAKAFSEVEVKHYRAERWALIEQIKELKAKKC